MSGVAISRTLYIFRNLLIFLAVGIGISSAPAQAQVTAFMQAVAVAASGDKALAEFYRSTNYQAIWTGTVSKDRARRAALLKALGSAGDHGLPQDAYETQYLQANLRSVRSQRDLGRIEVELSKLFLEYARDIQTGVLVPTRVNKDIVRKVPLRDRLGTLVNFSKSSPAGFLKSLVPDSAEYNRLMKEKISMERVVAGGGWGATVRGKKIEIGETGPQVVALRNRLIAMGYMKRSATQTYDAEIQRAVQNFQLAHGLNPDGVAGAGTLKEINTTAAVRLSQIMVAMERERWMNQPLGKRHIWVNLADFSAKIIDNGKVTFQTRSVVGANQKDRRSPEFSDVMEHMVINPTWNVPRSIAVKEYLPLLQKDPNAAGQLRLQLGKTIISREGIDFTEFTEEDFPYDLKQPPSDGNALGLVKFMFPNKYNIYLHDTPAKSLFERESRAFSHGCIRLNDPFDFAYALLARQVRNPEEYFQARLATRKENVVALEQPVPVHLVYRTAISNPKGGMSYRRDVYGRDAQIFAALQRAGVVLRSSGS
jgi:L,D-transpeptidase YcbB